MLDLWYKNAVLYCIDVETYMDDGERLIDLLADQPYSAIEGTSHDVQLEGYSYRWFRVGSHHL